jgi:hypothetical protein
MKLLKANLVFAFLFSYVREARFYNVVLGSENNHQKRRSYPRIPPLDRCFQNELSRKSYRAKARWNANSSGESVRKARTVGDQLLDESEVKCTSFLISSFYTAWFWVQTTKAFAKMCRIK